jgi:tRNA-dihydrouridine synthase A
VTVKSRIGIDDQAEWPALAGFVETVAAAGCTRFIVHARKAWLTGLSPRENRDIPPLRHDLVYRLKQTRPDLTVILNGGIAAMAEIDAHLRHVDGVMLGRAAYQNPYLLAAVDGRYFGGRRPVPTRHDIVRSMEGYIAAECAAGTPLAAMTRHMLGLFQGVPGARAWRRHLSENAHRPGAEVDVLRDAMAHIPATAPRAAE